MTASESWQRISELFGRAIDLPSHQRTELLDLECVEAPDIRKEVERLLGLHRAEDSFLQPPAPSEVLPTAASGAGMVGRVIGHFCIVRQIAVGGMSVVYEAEQDSPRRRVALKMVHPTLVSSELLRRLSFEAQVLARLRHPGIAQIFEAGVHDLGDGAQPYFAMELIDGEPVTTYAAAQRLDTRARIELLIKIALAVQHAHEKGVIHRDLKPANILVESGGQPKVLDFGVARLTDADVHTMQTAAGAIIGTLRYMSPEQLDAGAGNSDIDIRADIYALGVVGYELLAGRLPYDLPSGTIASAIRVIEQGAVVPLGRVDRSLRGDVESIFMKALEHDRARRYSSAADLADDLQRHLLNEPVRARPATTFYQVRKFARRNRALVGGVAATILALAIGLVMYAFQAREARLEAARSKYEADKAVAINNFMTNDFLMKLLAAVGKSQGSSAAMTSDLVDQATANVAVLFADQPLAEAAVRNEIATVYYNLGAFEKSSQQFQIALDRWQANLGPDHPDTLKAVNNLGQTLMHLRRPEEAEVLYQRALDGRLRALGEDDPFTLVTMNNLGTLYRTTGRLDEAEAMLRRTLTIQERVLGPSHKSTLTSVGNLGSVLLDRGQVDEALAMHRRMYETSSATLGADHVATLAAGSRLGQTLLRANQADEAQVLLESVLASFERTFGTDNTNTITTRRTLARVLKAQGKRDEAAAQLQLALASARSLPDGSQKLIAEIQKDLDELSATHGTASQPAQ